MAAETFRNLESRRVADPQLQLDLAEDAVGERPGFFQRFGFGQRRSLDFVERGFALFTVVPGQRHEALELLAFNGANADGRGVDAFRVGRVVHDAAPAKTEIHASTRLSYARVTERISGGDAARSLGSCLPKPERCPYSSKPSTSSSDGECAPETRHAAAPAARAKFRCRGQPPSRVIRLNSKPPIDASPAPTVSATSTFGGFAR